MKEFIAPDSGPCEECFDPIKAGCAMMQLCGRKFSGQACTPKQSNGESTRYAEWPTIDEQKIAVERWRTEQAL